MLLCDFDAAVQVGDVREGDVLGRFVGEKTRHVFGHGSHGTCEVKQPGAVVGVSVSFFLRGDNKNHRREGGLGLCYRVDVL